MTLALSAVLVLAAPTRLVVGVDGADLRLTRERPRVQALLRQLNGVEVRRLPYAVVVDVADAPAARAILSGRRDVRFVEEDVPIPVSLRALPDDPLYPEQWYLHEGGSTAALSAPPVWDVTLGIDVVSGQPVRVAVLDDGFDLAHDDLVGQLSADRLDVAQDPDDTDPSAGASEVHGTRTAGVVAATGFNGRGVVGVCPACQILPVRLIGAPPSELYTTGSAAALAVVWAVDHGAAVINNSWGPPDGNRFDPFHAMEMWPLPQALADALYYAAREGRGGLGSVVTWSAGNGNELATYDGFASDPRVLAVGAVTAAGVRADYSDYGPTVDLVAPSSGAGNDPAITTTDLTGSAGDPAGDYTSSYGGTSAAAAVVAGVAALVMARFPHLTAAQVGEALLLSAVAIDPERGRYTNNRSRWYGHGRVDPSGALAQAALYTDACTWALDVCANGRDDDCNGTVDDPAQCTPCVPEEPGETCDGADNNCDGLVDEFFVCHDSGRPFCAPCTSSTQCQVGSRCARAPGFLGTWCFGECGDGCAPGTACDGDLCVLTSTSEISSCLDVLGCAAGMSCGLVGVCAGSQGACVNDVWACARPLEWQSQETRCDGLDNDCDGLVDEHPLCAARAARIDDLHPQSCAGAPVALATLAAFAPWRRRRGAGQRNAASSLAMRAKAGISCTYPGRRDGANEIPASAGMTFSFRDLRSRE